MRRANVVAATVVALAIVTAAPVAAAPKPLDDVELEAAELAADTMPDEGWTEAPPEVIEPEPHTIVLAPQGGWCGGETDSSRAGQLALAGSAQVVLQKVVSPDEPYWFVWQSLWSFEEGDASAVAEAKGFVETIETAIDGCAGAPWMVSGGEVPNSVTPEVVKWPKVGKQRLAVELTTAGDGVTETTHVVYVRVANNVFAIHSRILPPDTALLKKIVKRAAKLLTKAAADA